MLHDCKVGITIKKVDNGFILKWEHQKPKRSKSWRSSSDVDEDWRDPSGTEIIIKEEDLIKRIKALIHAA